jgi:large subunit ribosomal protein L13
MDTSRINNKDINRGFFIVDADGAILGRLAVKAALLLSGKRKVGYTPNVDDGDFVVVVNASKVAVTGNKPKQKIYTHFTGYPGGLKMEDLETLLKRRPTEVIRHAVKGMLPKNKLGSRMITRLKVYAGTEHPHQAQNPVKITIGD